MKERHSSPEVAALIPQCWNLTAGTVEDIVFFGRITIREMICFWRRTAKSLASQIKDVDEKLTFLQGKGAADIRKIAKQYENPEFPQIGVRKDSWGNDPEPLDAASINRKRDATTFNFCGWCKYAGGGLCRYHYYITASCSIKTDAGLEDEERRFNTPCFLKEAPDKVFDEIRKGLARKRERLIEEKRKTDKKIKFLLALEKRAEKKPAMPAHRPYDWFNVGDPVVCYIGGWKERIVPDKFVTAKVINGYRHHNGCVSVCYDERVHSGEYLEGHGGGYGVSRPEVMHQWEFEYLLRHPGFASLWLMKGTSKHLEEFDAEQFLDALVKDSAHSKK